MPYNKITYMLWSLRCFKPWIDTVLVTELIWINMTSNDVFQKILRVLACNHELQYIICVNEDNNVVMVITAKKELISPALSAYLAI